MILTVETERESDGRWLAEVTSLPGVLAYGESRERALAAVQVLALRVVAERIEKGELPSSLPFSLSFIAVPQAP